MGGGGLEVRGKLIGIPKLPSYIISVMTTPKAEKPWGKARGMTVRQIQSRLHP